MNENSAKNLTAGLFVIFMVFVMIFIGFFMSGGFKSNKTITYVSNFTSISGLNEGSSVAYKGFKVGSVSNIEINPKNPKFVSVYMKLNSDVVIYTQTMAMIQAVGITGQSQIELSLKIDEGDNSISLTPIAINKNQIPEITSRISKFEDILDNVTGISKSLNEMAAKLNNMLSEDNMKDLNNVIDSANILLYNLSNSSIYFNKTLMNANDTISLSQETIYRLNRVLQTMEYDPAVIVQGVKH